MAVASSIADSHVRTLIHHGYAPAAALTGGFQLALWVCGLSGVAAVPVAFGLIRRHQKAPTAPRLVPGRTSYCDGDYYWANAAALGVGPERGPASCGIGKEACLQARR